MLYKEIETLQKEKHQTEQKIKNLYKILTNKENEYFSSLRICRACKGSLLDSIDVYCDVCLGDTDVD